MNSNRSDHRSWRLRAIKSSSSSRSVSETSRSSSFFSFISLSLSISDAICICGGRSEGSDLHRICEGNDLHWICEGNDLAAAISVGVARRSPCKTQHLNQTGHLKFCRTQISHRNEMSAMDDDGHQLPTLVYLATEKRPQCPHNFKAGSMNALIRVSSEISNAPIILNLDCDMYSNDSDAIKEALCFFMDEKHGHKTSYV
ncbi:Cellulose synthase-like protein E6 [Camellia lanceoleosa]|uniref:Cellulose synthase-like protein E6 n=1 Tax=Camellia lanceoleosa TaxID=1840588 RepID=A0ACC0FAI5_9ERIC|nr:Cellulose synthase-like protein E6 [Camellia lanceoleosa]